MDVQTIHVRAYCEEGMVGPEHFDIRRSQLPFTKLQLLSNEVGSSSSSAAASPAVLLPDGAVVLEVHVMSPDPYMRAHFKKAARRYRVGDALVGFVSGKVIASRNPAWPVHSLMGARLPYATVQVITAEQLAKTVAWNLTPYIKESELSLGVGVLGMPGSTVYGGLLDVLRPKQKETIFVSGAAGAVGGLVGQIAKNVFHCTVIGSCGGPAKCQFVKDVYGFDHAIDYKTTQTADDLQAALKRVAPQGIDMYFDNVGGKHFEAAFRSLKEGGRIAVCGGISQYDGASAATCDINPLQMVYTAQRIEGFVSTPWLNGERGNFLRDMHQFVREKKVNVVQETVYHGIDKFPEAFRALFVGANTGKVIVRTVAGGLKARL